MNDPFSDVLGDRRGARHEEEYARRREVAERRMRRLRFEEEELDVDGQMLRIARNFAKAQEQLNASVASSSKSMERLIASLSAPGISATEALQRLANAQSAMRSQRGHLHTHTAGPDV